jgi:GTP-dependent phosphoenolpyruvate carboxykinase
LLPAPNGIDRKGLDLSDDAMANLLRVDLPEWLEAVAGQDEYLSSFGARLPRGIRLEHDDLAKRIHDGVPTADLHGRDTGH